MPKYNVSVKSSNYQVLSEPQKKYNVGVNYEIPSKYLQYGNEILVRGIQAGQRFDDRLYYQPTLYHLYKDKQVIGYICSDEPPQ